MVLRSGLIVMAASAVVSSANAAEGVDEVLDRAAAHYGNLEYEQALTLLQQAQGASGKSREQLMLIFRYQGLCHSALGQGDDARVAFSKLLALEPSFRLGDNVSPRIREPFEALLRESPQRLDIQLSPPARAVIGEPLVYDLKVVSNPMQMARTLRIWLRIDAGGEAVFVSQAIPGAGGVQVEVPSSSWQGAKEGQSLHWWALVEDEHGSQLQRVADAEHPLSLSAVSAQRADAEPAAATPWYGQWWVWAVAGSVAAAAVVSTGIAIALSQQPASDEPVDFSVVFSTAEQSIR